MTGQIRVKKRSGELEPLNVDKFNKVIMHACEGLSGVSASEIAIKSNIQFYDKIPSQECMALSIRSAADLITEDTPNYQYVAGRLINYDLRKHVYGSFVPPKVKDHYDRIVEAGYYTPELGWAYTADEWKEFDKIIHHSRDNDLTYAGMEQLRGKYLVRNRVTGEIYETPQMAFLMIAATAFMKQDSEDRMAHVKAAYDAISQFDISLPTPVMAGLRTPERQLSSCTLIETDDNLHSITATGGAIIQYAANRAGIGIGASAIRGMGSPVRGGKVEHTGVIPFYKFLDAAVHSCSQGGVRKGSATLNVHIFHWEIEDIVVLKNNKGSQDNRIRSMDYCIQTNKYFYERFIRGENITLFSPSETPGLLEAFFTDDEKFIELYEKYERSRVRKKSIPAIDLFESIAQERVDTGRIYLMNIDHCNNHGSYIRDVAPIKMTNLCVEVTQHTKPLQGVDDPDGEISLCVLGAVNLGKVNVNSDLEKPCEILVRILNAVIDYQDYPLPAAENSTINRRHIGIGIINLAYWLAKRDYKYDGITAEGKAAVHSLAEAYSYYIIKASIKLAQERGAPCPAFNDTKWSQGLLPIDTYKKEVDEIVDPTLHQDWDALRTELYNHGILNTCLMAGMPSETSSQLSNATNGFEPPISLVSKKGSKDGILKQVVPEIRKLKNKYQLRWDQKSNKGYLEICAIFQKFMDQAISVNTWRDPRDYPDNKIPTSILMEDILYHYRLGGKNLYYHLTMDGAGEMVIDLPEGEIKQEECESCVL